MLVLGLLLCALTAETLTFCLCTRTKNQRLALFAFEYPAPSAAPEAKNEPMRACERRSSRAGPQSVNSLLHAFAFACLEPRISFGGLLAAHLCCRYRTHLALKWNEMGRTNTLKLADGFVGQHDRTYSLSAAWISTTSPRQRRAPFCKRINRTQHTVLGYKRRPFVYAQDTRVPLCSDAI